MQKNALSEWLNADLTGFLLEKSGDGGIRTLVPRRANAFRVRPVMTASIRLHNNK